MDANHFLQSSSREKVIEYLFVGQLLRFLWCRGVADIDVLHPAVDRSGYDLVLEANGIIRHIQLKASHRRAKTASVGLSLGLAGKPSGCALWIMFDPHSLDLGPFLWFGGSPGTPLPPLGDAVARHTKADASGTKAPRPNIRVVRKGLFTPLATIAEVAIKLFGEMAGAAEIGPSEDHDLLGLQQALRRVRSGRDVPWSDADISLSGETLPIEVAEFVDDCNRLGWVRTDFDWLSWVKTPEAVLLQQPGSLAQAMPDQIAKLITALVRQDRLCAGTIRNAVRNGVLPALEQRVGMLLAGPLSEPPEGNTALGSGRT